MKSSTAHIRLSWHGKSADGRTYCALRISSGGGKSEVMIVDLEELTLNPRICFATINRAGGRLITRQSKSELQVRISEFLARVPARVVADKIGFHGESFVFPDAVVGPAAKELKIRIRSDVADSASKFIVSESRDRSILKAAATNSRLLLSVGVVLSGFVSALFGFEYAGVQLFGTPGSGKSTILVAAASMLGSGGPSRPGGNFAETFNNTPGKLETLAIGHNNTALCLDETQAATARQKDLTYQLLDWIMRIDAGRERGRLDEPHPPRAFGTAVLTTSNKSLDELGVTAGVEITDAHRSRLIDVPPPADRDGFFEDLNGHESVAAFSAHLRSVASKSFGWPGRLFVERLIADYSVDRSKARRTVDTFRQEFLSRVPGGTHPRTAEKLATVYAALRLARKYSLIKALRIGKPLLSCVEDHNLHVAKKLPSTADAVRSPRERLVKFLKDERHRFGFPSEPSSPWDTLCYAGAHKGQVEFWFPTKILEKVVGGTARARQLNRELAAEGLVGATGGGNQGDRHVVKRRIGKDRKLVVAVSAKILG